MIHCNISMSVLGWQESGIITKVYFSVFPDLVKICLMQKTNKQTEEEEVFFSELAN